MWLDQESQFVMACAERISPPYWLMVILLSLVATQSSRAMMAKSNWPSMACLYIFLPKTQNQAIRLETVAQMVLGRLLRCNLSKF